MTTENNFQKRQTILNNRKHRFQFHSKIRLFQIYAGREAATLGAGRRRSLPIVDPSRSTAVRTAGVAAAANLADASFDSSTSASQAYLIPPYHLPLHLEREIQSRNYNFTDAGEAQVVRDSATPVVSTPKTR
uniref:Uncharacterized protein n=1 Tax=Romanomermis culicivorax TaxID=13658 RepID=A0A915KZC5_ROMCU